MSLFSKYSILFLSIALCSCGFTPVYKADNYVDGSTTAREDLASIEVIAPHDLTGQFFQTTLSDLLSPTAKSAPLKYRLEIKLDKSDTALAIEQDRTITRYKVVVVAHYKLIEIDTTKVLSEGSLKREGGYDKVPSDYATYVSSEDSTRRVTKELAADTKLRIMAALIKK
jgi:hypothetical protein